MMSELPSYDELVVIAKEDPERLEQIRKHFVEKQINQAPEHTRPRLRGLQFRIDGIRAIHKSPMGSCVEISRMMYESVGKLRDALTGQEVIEPEPQMAKAAGNVLAFPQA